jgi:hypothetical protein
MKAVGELDLARPAEQKEPVPVAVDIHGRQSGDDRDDRFRPGHLGAEAVDCLDRQPATYVSDGPKASNGRTSSDLRINVPSTTVTPIATPITLSSVRRQSAINAAR